MHVGSFTSGGTLREAAEKLSHIRDLGRELSDVVSLFNYRCIWMHMDSAWMSDIIMNPS